jgi:hypothetical protein
MSAADTRREPFARRTFQPVRRRSRMAGGDWERAYRTTLAPHQLRRLPEAADKLNARTRARGRRNGEGGGLIAAKLLRYLINVALKHRGRIERAITAMAGAIDVSVGAVCRALDALERAGFLARARRLQPAEGEPHARGPAVEQAVNLYRLDMPPSARTDLGAAAVPPPVPADEAARKAAMRKQIAAYEAEDQAARREAFAATLPRGPNAILPPGENPGS